LGGGRRDKGRGRQKKISKKKRRKEHTGKAQTLELEGRRKKTSRSNLGNGGNTLGYQTPHRTHPRSTGEGGGMNQGKIECCDTRVGIQSMWSTGSDQEQGPKKKGDPRTLGLECWKERQVDKPTVGR